ncbi:hypothetical protein [Roseivirga sp. UBA1976]|uniref:hypothetical protein n=1 Tax=Roseivirga sp. UBA1976 TaxID=1947386 RepID=UPI00257EA937|nr:hypothetical protein [Roseivirga sp. UBA1976]|tara:strand:+ start:10062 stop:10604 length:543 start_codon:yes stop_codon:yes gene_type:complete
MKKTILIIILSIGCFSVNAQQDDIISISEFQSIKFNSHTMKQLMEVTDYEAFLKQHYGNPTQKRCSDNPMMPYGCDLYYNGFQLGFDYDDVLMDIIIDGGSNSFTYNNKVLKPGMSIYEVRSLFPNSYNNRYKIKRANNTEDTFVRVMVGHNESPSAILFKLNTNFNVVSEISIDTGGEQ